MSHRRTSLVAAGLLALVLSACSGADDPAPEVAGEPAPTAASDAPPPAHHAPAAPAKLKPLRAGERRVTMTMPETYTPSAPTGTGTDDYRCFLLDPRLARDSYLTGTNVVPGNPDVVHHVILFRVPPDQVAAAEERDAETEGLGWTCFGGTGLDGEFQNPEDAPWLGAWAPGGEEAMVKRGHGVELPRGSRVVMQVHYNLLAGASPDMSSTQIRVRAHDPGITPLHTFLLPAPVEMPCRPGHDASPLCDRDAALADARDRFGSAGGALAQGLHFLCGTDVVPSEVTECTRTLGRGMTIHAVAGHMHLLGRRITIETDPGTPDARTVMDIRPWNFDDQGSRSIEPVHLDAFDTVKVTCRHVQWLRDRLPAFETQREDHYVVWGEGTTDEMCLGMLSVAFDDE
ncbi:hypothetical protein [Nocardioides sp. cx-173]|uniref:hypothetical protein n=1 Tax=Nocardioides sp. cx-173 TaxID=2898796 RepID=UPI001E2C8D50|nr:hypothetical protein [Nocardioides sp. cx-173]MCD4527157.1 hypothetical protein [Nocardioides sp. cx-173]UGB40486.1 hypothetical protein LQ940_13980 [Nocardioides sp. cx-173]